MTELRPARGLHFDPETHIYTFEGKRIPSVSEIIRPAIGWFGRRDEEAADRGLAVHTACEDIDAGFEPDAPPEIAGYLSAYRKFLEESGAQVVASEYRVFHAAMRYAGTVDRVVRFGDGGSLAILDLKTGALAPWMGLQLGAYSMAAWHSGALAEIPAMLVLELRHTGEYRLHELRDPKGNYEGFVGLIRFWTWRQKFEER